MNPSLKKWFVTSSLIISSFCSSTAVNAASFTELVVFSDSLSDLGRAFTETGGTFPLYGSFTNGRYSNGPVWVEYLADSLGIATNPNTNYAIGGALTGNINAINFAPGFSSPPAPVFDGLTQQIASYTDYDPHALYIVWAGANDYLFGEEMTPMNPISNLQTNLQTLLINGAKNILVGNLPNLGDTPGVNNLPQSGGLNLLTQGHNNALSTTLDILQTSFPHANITLLDANKQFQTIVNNPSLFGLTNVADSCLSGAGPCSNPDEYLFWDSIHPTTRGHQLISNLALEALGVPEPSAVFSLIAIGISGIFLKQKV
ncbi:MAG: SGNH/GDSL hydrolase family protein [Crocosphaera sp.]